MIISGSYVMAMALSNPGSHWSQSPLNPSVALAIMSMSTFNGQIAAMNWAWIYITFPWIGAILAVICYEYGFKKAQDVVQRDEEHIERQEEGIENGQPLLDN
jgi:glycerol uptake facilitator-like aquaporin